MHGTVLCRVKSVCNTVFKKVQIILCCTAVGTTNHITFMGCDMEDGTCWSLNVLNETSGLFLIAREHAEKQQDCLFCLIRDLYFMF